MPLGLFFIAFEIVSDMDVSFASVVGVKMFTTDTLTLLSLARISDFAEGMLKMK